jgi:hypothetical protein
MKQTAPPLAEGANPYLAAKEKYAGQFAALRKHLVTQGAMTADVDEKLTEAEKAAEGLLADSAKRYDEGKAQLAAGKKKLEAGLPDWAKKMLGKAGFDPDGPSPLTPLTREEVIERHGKGLPLSGRNMAGLALSGIDLTGADLRTANLQKANLSGSTLDNVDFAQAICNEADLSKASLKGAKIARGIFQKAKFPGADLTGADLTQAVMSEADLTGATLTGAVLVKTLLEKAILKNVRAPGASASKVYLLSADLTPCRTPCSASGPEAGVTA